MALFKPEDSITFKLLFVLNALLFILSTAGLITGAMFYYGLGDKVQILCSFCTDAGVVQILGFTFLFVLSIICVLGMISRSPGILFGYMLFIVICAMIILSFIIVTVLLQKNVLDDKMQTTWNKIVSFDNDKICDIQNFFNCSGWSENCIINTRTTVCGSCNITHTSTCKTFLDGKVSAYGYLVYSVGSITLVTTLVLAFMTYIANKSMQEVDKE